jgi:hypothetical protein
LFSARAICDHRFDSTGLNRSQPVPTEFEPTAAELTQVNPGVTVLARLWKTVSATTENVAVNTQSHEVNLDWIPASGFQLRRAGVQFDALRVDGKAGLLLADVLEEATGGDPGPVVAEANGRRGVYFLVPPGSTSHRSWPVGVTRLSSGFAHVSYIPVPALSGRTWPLSWRCPPSAPGRFVHALLLRSAAEALHGSGRLS